MSSAENVQTTELASSKDRKLALRWVGHSETGLVRKNNQDSAYASPTALIVADGMGGAAAGDLASALVIKEMARLADQLVGEEMLQALSAAVDRAADTISELIYSDSNLDGMGSTATGALFDGKQLGLLNIGDSRTYLFRDGELIRLTHDHSFVQTLVDDGRISEADALTHPHRSLILRVINGQAQNAPDLELFPVQVGDRILVCSDGLCGMVTDPAIAANLGGELADVVTRLVDMVYAEGAQDNITILLADVVAGDSSGAAELFGAAAHLQSDPLNETTGQLPVIEAEPRPDPGFAENVRYSPTAKHRRMTWVKLLLAISLPLLVIIAGGGFWYLYTQQQYYVGVAEHKVAIYQGIADPVLNLPLSSVVQLTDTNLADLPRFYRNQVTNAEYHGSMDSVEATVADLKRRAAICILERTQPTVPPNTPAPGQTSNPLPDPDSECE